MPNVLYRSEWYSARQRGTWQVDFYDPSLGDIATASVSTLDATCILSLISKHEADKLMLGVHGATKLEVEFDCTKIPSGLVEALMQPPVSLSCVLNADIPFTHTASVCVGAACRVRFTPDGKGQRTLWRGIVHADEAATLKPATDSITVAFTCAVVTACRLLKWDDMESADFSWALYYESTKVTQRAGMIEWLWKSDVNTPFGKAWSYVGHVMAGAEDGDAFVRAAFVKYGDVCDRWLLHCEAMTRAICADVSIDVFYLDGMLKSRATQLHKQAYTKDATTGAPLAITDVYVPLFATNRFAFAAVTAPDGSLHKELQESFASFWDYLADLSHELALRVCIAYNDTFAFGDGGVYFMALYPNGDTFDVPQTLLDADASGVEIKINEGRVSGFIISTQFKVAEDVDKYEVIADGRNNANVTIPYVWRTLPTACEYQQPIGKSGHAQAGRLRNTTPREYGTVCYAYKPRFTMFYYYDNPNDAAYFGDDAFHEGQFIRCAAWRNVNFNGDTQTAPLTYSQQLTGGTDISPKAIALTEQLSGLSEYNNVASRLASLYGVGNGNNVATIELETDAAQGVRTGATDADTLHLAFSPCRYVFDYDPTTEKPYLSGLVPTSYIVRAVSCDMITERMKLTLWQGF